MSSAPERFAAGFMIVPEPVAQGGGPGREAGGEAALVAGGAEYEVGVAPPLRLAGAQGHGLVAAELDVVGAAGAWPARPAG